MLRVLLAFLLLVALPHAASADLLTKVGTFSIDSTKTATQTQAVTGVGFQPKAIIFFWNGRIDTVDAVGARTVRPGMGFATLALEHRAMTAYSANAQATSVTGSGAQNNQAIIIMNGASAIDGTAGISSMDSDGFTLVINDQFTSNFTIGYLALAGSDITNVDTGGTNSGTTTGNVGFTGVGFQPDTVIIINTADRSSESFGAEAAFGIGAAAGASPTSATVSIGMKDAVTTPNTKRYGRTGDVLAGMNSSGTFNSRASLNSWDSDGFTLNFATAAGSRRFYWLAIKGAKFAVKDFLTDATSTTNDITITGVGFQPQAMLVFSHATSASSAGTAQDHAEMSIGASTAINTGIAMSILDEDKGGVSNTETASAIDTDKVYVHISTADAVEGGMNLHAIGSDGVTFRMFDIDPSQSYAFAWFIGPASLGACSGRLALLGVGC